MQTLRLPSQGDLCSDLLRSAPHTGRSSQLALEANGRSAQFLATLVASAVILTLTLGCEHLARKRKRTALIVVVAHTG